MYTNKHVCTRFLRRTQTASRTRGSSVHIHINQLHTYTHIHKTCSYTFFHTHPDGLASAWFEGVCEHI